ncbi:hypothetical protein EJ06DRAFT_534662 [Trichodelitschia bisporula]|uniref:Uncharacterized protein n=1 Tax=Trichodelitschia bisporula TaxID=703511 RepID=A0A6G1HIB4_9PEZI|nr:hypothetical protein EJ06DRAFT_534662 [Trichodelitschia bisporula]
MHPTLLLSLLLASGTSAAVLKARDSPVPNASSITASSPPVKVEDVKPRIRPSAKRQYILYGPIKLPASMARTLRPPTYASTQANTLRMAARQPAATRMARARRHPDKSRWTRMERRLPLRWPAGTARTARC